MPKLTYSRNGDYYAPDLTLTKQPVKPMGKYGRRRKRYLKEYRPSLCSSLILSEKLYPHLLQIDKVANHRLELLMPKLMKSAGVAEQ